MVPKWVLELMAKDRARCGMERDEHERPIEEEKSIPPNQPPGHRAYPGYLDYRFTSKPKQDPQTRY
jgi:hypothetical protein